MSVPACAVVPDPDASAAVDSLSPPPVSAVIPGPRLQVPDPIEEPWLLTSPSSSAAGIRMSRASKTRFSTAQASL
ncbi:hypothetical protein ACFQL1_04040 [Halomicroarcula sp. GCM10025709]|uniref:hypothetical protein n=1 Tax=Halomicroarcula sp. GCM10025709 TaxID=3252669 RepID=UPI00360E58DB